MFTKLLKPVVRQISCLPDNISGGHTDDAPGKNPSRTICQLTCQLFGLIVNQMKSILTPTQELEFLGFQLCSTSMRLSVPTEKLCKIQQDARRMLQQASVSVREIARFVGKTTATLRAIPLAPLHYQALQMQMNSFLFLSYNQETNTIQYSS